MNLRYFNDELFFCTHVKVIWSSSISCGKNIFTLSNTNIKLIMNLKSSYKYSIFKFFFRKLKIIKLGSS